MKTNSVIKIRIEKLDDDLNGVAFRGGKKYVIPRTLTDEIVQAEIIKEQGSAVICRLINIIEPSPNRIKAPCKYYDKCGGCDLLHTDYENQKLLKTALVKRKMSKFNFCDVSPCISVKSLFYRNKVHICFNKSRNVISAGFFDKNNHIVANIPNCICQGKWYKSVVAELLRWINKFNVSIYDPKTKTGLLRFAVVRVLNNNILLSLVITKKRDLPIDYLYQNLLKYFDCVSIYANINNEISNEVLAGSFIHLIGAKNIKTKFGDIIFSLSPDAFFQINENMAEIIYRDIANEILSTDCNKVVDLFSGIGLTCAILAKEGKKVESVEITKSAVENARLLAVENNVADNILFHQGDCGEIIKKINDINKSVVFVDPPRRGLTETVAKYIADAEPKKIIYLSCNLQSLVSDLKIFIDKDYKITSVVPYDMFPSTKHIETLVCLVKKS